MAEQAESPATETKPTTGIFGSGTTFGAGGGFGAFGGGGGFGAVPAAAVAKPEEEGEEAGAADEEGAPEEECQAEFKPIVQLEEVEKSTGEESEDVLLELKSKLYRFDNSCNEWKERGIGQAKLLQHKENKKVRMLMRQDKTLKIRANHIVMPNVKLQEHAGSDKAWVWSTVDFAEESQKVELFCIRFANVERAQLFKTKFEEAQAINATLITCSPADDDDDEDDDDEEENADDVAESLAKVTVEDKEEEAAK